MLFQLFQKNVEIVRVIKLHRVVVSENFSETALHVVYVQSDVAGLNEVEGLVLVVVDAFFEVADDGKLLLVLLLLGLERSRQRQRDVLLDVL